LGVGGIAAALALQTLLADVFASLSMYFDRPFDIGDFVTIGEFLGTVEEIGLRTTRLRALSGEQIVYPNGELIKSQIRNYARMSERRILFRFGIEYNLAPEKVEMAARLPREVIESVDGVRFDRCHFATYGDYALEYEVVYYVLSPDYAVYMDRHHAINLGMYRRFRDEGIPFAFPTRTLIHRTEQPAPTQDRAT
jgi:small-conductance mechanosensitive channel